MTKRRVAVAGDARTSGVLGRCKNWTRLTGASVVVTCRSHAGPTTAVPVAV